MPGYSIEFFAKVCNLPGLQIADLVSTPIGRRFLDPNGRSRAFEVIQQKFERGPNGDPAGRGLQVFP
jgi:hypothetical protein